MLSAEKANRRVRIPDDKKDEYVAMGYTIKSMEGDIVKEPDDPKKEAEALKMQVAELEESLEAERGRIGRIEELEAELKLAKEYVKSLEANLHDANISITDLNAKLAAATKRSIPQKAAGGKAKMDQADKTSRE